MQDVVIVSHFFCRLNLTLCLLCKIPFSHGDIDFFHAYGPTGKPSSHPKYVKLFYMFFTPEVLWRRGVTNKYTLSVR